jgi:hypothetical protein
MNTSRLASNASASGEIGKPDITLYFAPASRAFTPRWLLEELGLPYKVETIDIRKGGQQSPDYLRINPMGKVPAADRWRRHRLGKSGHLHLPRRSLQSG